MKWDIACAFLLTPQVEEETLQRFEAGNWDRRPLSKAEVPNMLKRVRHQVVFAIMYFNICYSPKNRNAAHRALRAPELSVPNGTPRPPGWTPTLPGRTDCFLPAQDESKLIEGSEVIWWGFGTFSGEPWGWPGLV